jgi:hypothetical protein
MKDCIQPAMITGLHPNVIPTRFHFLTRPANEMTGCARVSFFQWELPPDS